MSRQLLLSTGQCSDKGRKEINQDFHGLRIPQEPLLSSKGIAVALADGISSSPVSQIASESAVKAFLEDYYCTSESWTVKTSVYRVLLATNSWLLAQTQQSRYRFDKDKGYVCTFSCIVIKSTTAHIFHIGDSRVYRVLGNALELLTEDHRLWVSKEESYLSRALGVHRQIEIDYRSLALEEGDIFVLATDGVYEFTPEKFISETLKAHATDLDRAAQIILEKAYENGSKDNLTIQIVRIDGLPARDANQVYRQLTALPFPPKLEPRMVFDGYQIVRELYVSSRSHVYLAVDRETQTQVVIKTPSVGQRHNIAYLERFLMEEWVARRLNNPHVLKPGIQARQRHFLYLVTEFIEGQTLAQWMIDHPKPDIESVRKIIEQIAQGIRAFHRQEMLHQDLRPNNVMIDRTGTVKIIDFGSTQVAGLQEIASPLDRHEILGTAQYTAPEYFLGESGSSGSDLFSLAVIAYQMLSGRLPYGTEVAKTRTKAAQRRLSYRSVLDENRAIPAWIDGVLKKALHPNPYHRYEALSEFVYDLRHPNQAYLNQTRPPIMERNPVAFWKTVSLFLAIAVIALIVKLK